MTGRKLLYSGVLFFALCLLSPGPGRAKTITVNSFYDVPDLTPGDGLCVAYLIIIPPFVFPVCTLRAAIEEANHLAGDDEIVLRSVTYALDSEGTDNDDAVSGDLDIVDSVTISGEGREETVIDGGELGRIFDIHGADTRVSIHDLTLQNGKVLAASEGIDQGGGAIRNYGIVTLSEVVLTENTVEDGGSGDTGGGALYNQGTCDLTATSVFLNGARSGGAVWNGTGATMRIEKTTLRHNHSRLGGGVFNQGTLSLVNSTVSRNSGSDDASKASGIYNSGEMEIVQSTVAENNDEGQGSGLFNEGQVTILNSVIASHDGQDCVLSVPLTSLGGNLDSDSSCSMDHEADLSGANPLLTPLGANGGSTWSHSFLLGSPLVDNGLDSSEWEITADQRGKGRPKGKGCDIGAVELQFSTITPVLVPFLL